MNAALSLRPLDTQALLRRLALFENLSPAELAQIAAATSQLNVEAGTRLFERGDLSQGFHLIVQGCVTLVMETRDGDEKVIEIMGAGQSFGEAAMFLDAPYMVSAVAVEDSHLLHVAKRAVTQEIERSPVFAQRMLASVSRRLHLLMSDIEAVTLRSATERVVQYFLRCMESQRGVAGKIVLPVSKGLLASKLNITREHFSRVLHCLVKEELVVVQGRVIRVLDPVRLAAYAA